MSSALVGSLTVSSRLGSLSNRPTRTVDRTTPTRTAGGWRPLTCRGEPTLVVTGVCRAPLPLPPRMSRPCTHYVIFIEEHRL